VPAYRLDIAYDGTAFRGYARNEGVRTVQGELEEVIARVSGRPVDTTVAGRTDAGVHARHNVVGFQVPEPLDPARLGRAVTSLLGPEIVATGAAEARDGFNPRFEASSRVYRYAIDRGPVPDPLRRWSTWHVPEALDLPAMQRACGFFVGEHDFASLCRKAEGRSTVRTVMRAEWRAEDPDLLVFETEATSFCHQMVRSMVALCVEVGRGRVDPGSVAGILEARDRNAARGAAPPHGLVLWEVRF
jgi:tRNA pseudouridine38-40 synthase